MKQERTYKMVGFFVILGFASFIAIIYNYLQNKFSTDESNYVVMYFEESIQGLNVGSPVMFKGVEIGKVARIRLLTNIKEGTFKTPVFVSFEGKKALRSGSDGSISAKMVLHSLIEKGLRARLVSASYLTGQLMIELNMDPTSPAILHGTGTYMEIPTVLSSFGMISKDLQEIPFRENMLQLGNLLKQLDEKLPPILDNLNKVTAKVDNLLEVKSKETSQAVQSFEEAMDNIGQASLSIKNLTDYLERHPEAILMGKEK